MQSPRKRYIVTNQRAVFFKPTERDMWFDSFAEWVYFLKRSVS